MRLTILGLGPGPASLLTQQAADVLHRASEVYLRTEVHPTVADLPARLKIRSFDHLYNSLPTFEAVYAEIVEQVWQLARRPEGVLYAVPGHPMVAEATVRGLLDRARAVDQPVEIVAGLSFIEPALTAAGVDPYAESEAGAGLQLVDALTPDVDPARPALIAQVYGRDAASRLKLELLELYPPEHQVTVIIAAGCADQRTLTLPLFELDRQASLDHLTSMYLPPLGLTENVASFRGLVDIIAKLRAPDGCPWDREQTHESLKPYIIEESYEAVEAIERGELDGLQEELGDVLLNILLHCQIAAEAGTFTNRDVIRAISEKLIRRHPHVFGELQLASAEQVVQNWEALKSKEREGREERASMLKGLPKSLPALAFARSLQERLAPLGLPIEQPLQQAPEVTELGRQLFHLAVAAAAAGENPEELLRHANTHFTRAFQRLEALAWETGRGVVELPPAERAALWERAWREEPGG